jgi:16S rRNA (guanine527-N7)-methyltransferase
LTINESKQVYFNLLHKWNKAYNLVQEKTVEDFENRHWKDCYQIVSLIPENSRILDVGSGAGFPGIVLAMAGFNVTLCEINQKKMIFLKEVTRLCHLHNVSFATDINNVMDHYDVVVSRAFSNLTDLLGIMKNVSRETSSTVGIFLKGKTFQEEIENARLLYDFDVDITPSQTSADSVILKIRNLKI